MIIIGLTGAIASGKSTTADMFRAWGIPVYDADAVVHALYAGELNAPIAQLVPEAVQNGAVNRDALRAWIQKNPEHLLQLEEIVHPVIAIKRAEFIETAKISGYRMCVLDVPLLFEVGLYQQVDVVVFTHAHEDIRQQRLQARPNFNLELHEKLQANQWPIEKKRLLAHYIIDTGLGYAHAGIAVNAVIRALGAVVR